MQIQQNMSLANYTSFHVGGAAEELITVQNTKELLEAVSTIDILKPLWLLGAGCNVLVSDAGLPGTTLRLQGGNVEFYDDGRVEVDAGVWWDDVVTQAVERNLWGIECMSEVPGTTGAALFINITAYGQAIADIVQWIEVWNKETRAVERLTAGTMTWGYKQSLFQTKEGKKYIILRAGLQLSHSMVKPLEYQRALDAATEHQLDPNILAQRREAIIHARRAAGSLLENDVRTVGSFFRNPVVTPEQAEEIIRHDESGKTAEQIRKMNTVHGGDSQRVSAAHVMLAAGFGRGQQWGAVKLNDRNLLKIEALEGATATDIYTVSRHIQKECQQKIGVHLQPEAVFLGEFEPAEPLV